MLAWLIREFSRSFFSCMSDVTLTKSFGNQILNKVTLTHSKVTRLQSHKPDMDAAFINYMQ